MSAAAPLREPWAQSWARLETAIAWSMNNGGPIEGSVSPDGQFSIRRPWSFSRRAPSRPLSGRLVAAEPVAAIEIAPAEPIARYVTWAAVTWFALLVLALLAARIGWGFGVEPVLLFSSGGVVLLGGLFTALVAGDRSFLVAQLAEILQVPLPES